MNTPNTIGSILRGSQDWYRSNYASANLSLTPQRAQILDNTCSTLISNKLRYQSVERSTNVPWYFIGSLHYRESDFSFSRYLGNGDPLLQRTTHVPAGRGPFSTWEAGAVDALEHIGLSGRPVWNIPLSLELGERFNGEGYFEYHPNTLDPYLWSYTDLYVVGKYGSDGHFDPFLVDQEAGMAAIFKELQARGEI